MKYMYTLKEAYGRKVTNNGLDRHLKTNRPVNVSLSQFYYYFFIDSQFFKIGIGLLYSHGLYYCS